MKSICLVFLMLAFSCNSGKKATQNTTSEANPKKIMETFQCPEDGKCAWEVMANKSLVVKEDGTGMLYPEFIENTGTSVIKYKYHRESPKGVSDGNYTEEVYFEVQNETMELALQGEELQKAKMLYNRMCFCERRTVGYFKVTDGELKYSKNKQGEAIISLDFQNNRVPQTIQNLYGKVMIE